VIGVGGVGHIVLQLVRVLGAGAVVAIDTDGRRRNLARELGADEVLGEQDDVAGAVRELTDGDGADVVLDFVGTDETHGSGLAMLARRGVYSVVGYGGTVSVPSVALVAGDFAIDGNLVGNWIDLWEILQLHGRGEIVLQTETHPLDEVNDVLVRLREGEVTGRAVLVP
jgi:NAD+-dependent secondary alcohol dehydrogenase Adh1